MDLETPRVRKWGKSQPSVFFLFGPKYLTLPRPVNGYFFSKFRPQIIYFHVLNPPRHDGDNVDLWKFDPPRTIFSQKKFYWDGFSTSAILKKSRSRASCWFCQLVDATLRSRDMGLSMMGNPCPDPQDPLKSSDFKFKNTHASVLF